MSFFKIFVFILIIVTSNFYCNNNNSSSSSEILGGYLESPDDPQIHSTKGHIFAKKDDLSELTDIDVPGGLDLIDESKSEPDTISEMNHPLIYNIDPFHGKWFKIENKPLNRITEEKFIGQILLINKYKNEIKKYIRLINDNNRSILSAEINLIQKSIIKIREKIGYGRCESGIYSTQANQKLFLNVKNNKKNGFYKLSIFARNKFGYLPQDYKKYNITIKDSKTGLYHGGILINASDHLYQKGSAFVYLEKGDSRLELNWTNDAYKKNQYDVNIQIKKIILEYAKKKKSIESLVKQASEYSSIKGRFYWDNKSVRTYWDNQQIGFNYSNLLKGKYKIIIEAKNYGIIPPEYKNFRLKVNLDKSNYVIDIPVSKKYKKGIGIIEIPGGNTDISLTWLNDEYKNGKYDSNIQIRKIALKRVGNLPDSVLTAYLLNTKNGNRMIILGIFIVLLISLVFVSYWNKRKVLRFK